MNFDRWEEFGYESKEEYQDAYDDYLVQADRDRRAENELQEDS